MTGPAAPRPHSDGDRVGALVLGPALLARGAASIPVGPPRTPPTRCDPPCRPSSGTGRAGAPSAPAPALPLDLEKAAKEDLQSRALRLNGVASLAGLPSVSLPLAQVDGLPVGLALIGPAGADPTLLAAASQE